MNKQLLLIATSVFLLGCADLCANITTSKTEVNTPQTKTNSVKYTCNRNILLSVNFTHSNTIDEQSIAIINRVGKQSIILPNTPVSSGFMYTNGKYKLRVQGQKITWTVGRMTPFQCVVTNHISKQEDAK